MPANGESGMNKGHLAWLAAALLLAGCSAGNWDDVDPQKGTPLVVDKAGDDGSEGTLRWAIVKSNADPGKYKIVLTPPPGGELVIKPTAQLPAIVGPARIEGPWTGTGTPTVALDGSAWLDMAARDALGNPTACPGEAAGQFGPNARSLRNTGLQVADSRDVEITGFEVRNFCIGIMSQRSHDNFIHAMRLVGNLGAAGILVTGDDGSAAGGAAGNSTHNVLERIQFVGNTGGLDIARGAARTVVRTSTFVIDGQPVGSTAIDIFSSDDVVLEGNRIEGYETGVQMGGTGHKLTGNVVRANGIGVTQPAGSNGLNTLSETAIYANTRINLGLNGTGASIPNDEASACSDRFPDCTLPQNHPVLAGSVFESAGFLVKGTLSSRPAAKFSIEVFASHTAGVDGLGEGEVFLGRVEVTSDANGAASFQLRTGTDPLKDGARAVYFTATATRASNGATSEFSRPQLVQRP
jgi:3-dehydroshikimate dehydratase